MSELIINSYLHEMVEAGASDLFFTHGCPPCLRINSNIIAMDRAVLENSDIEVLIDDLLDDEQQDEFSSTFELNVALALDSGERFRVNIFKQKHYVGMVIRFIKSVIPTFDELGLPRIYADFIMEKRGLLLIVGATGSGKSTSLASMIELRNIEGSGHVVMIEDPIEFVHEHKGCMFMQREIGIDTYSYGIALKNALRQSPDILVIGEIRDRETMESAILFCETGHLVVATLHANNSNQAIERIVNLFPEEMHKQILITLSQNINAIASQRLIKNLEGTRSLAYEILLNKGLIKVLIEEGKVKEIKEIMEKSRDLGMITFDQCLYDLFKKDLISEEEALKESDNPNNLRLRFSQEHVVEAMSNMQERNFSDEYHDNNF